MFYIKYQTIDNVQNCDSYNLKNRFAAFVFPSFVRFCFPDAISSCWCLEIATAAWLADAVWEKRKVYAVTEKTFFHTVQWNWCGKAED
jgi:hypothetical protein